MKGTNDLLHVCAYKTASGFFVFDTFVNWILGILFLFFYKPVESLIADSKLIPDAGWLMIGAGLFLFGIWQTFILIKGKLIKGALLFSSIMAYAPVLLLTFGLFIAGPRIHFAAALAIWAGNLYMLALGTIYLVAYLKIIKLARL